ncbi:unnamed protein product, partial [Didymodactylos carnosus]
MPLGKNSFTTPVTKFRSKEAFSGKRVGAKLLVRLDVQVYCEPQKAIKSAQKKDDADKNSDKHLGLDIHNNTAKSVTEHEHVCCDACQQIPITGVRYKCLQCPDYDLCQACYIEKKMHNEHCMAVIRHPCQ